MLIVADRGGGGGKICQNIADVRSLTILYIHSINIYKRNNIILELTLATSSSMMQD